MQTTLKLLLTRIDTSIPRVMLSTVSLYEHKDKKTLYLCLVPLTCATCVAHIILHYVIIQIIFLDNKTMKILSEEAPESSFYFLPLRSQYSTRHPFNLSSTLL
jgi:hypothetical protein